MMMYLRIIKMTKRRILNNEFFKRKKTHDHEDKQTKISIIAIIHLMIKFVIQNVMTVRSSVQHFPLLPFLFSFLILV